MEIKGYFLVNAPCAPLSTTLSALLFANVIVFKLNISGNMVY